MIVSPATISTPEATSPIASMPRPLAIPATARPDSGEVVFLCIASARVNFRSCRPAGALTGQSGRLARRFGAGAQPGRLNDASQPCGGSNIDSCPFSGMTGSAMLGAAVCQCQ